MITFKKPKFGIIPKQIRDVIISWDDDKVEYDETKLTPTQNTKLQAFLKYLGYLNVADLANSQP